MHYGPSTYRTYTGSRVLRVQFLQPNLGQFAQTLQFSLLICNMGIALVMSQIVVKGLNGLTFFLSAWHTGSTRLIINLFIQSVCVCVLRDIWKDVQKIVTGDIPINIFKKNIHIYPYTFANRCVF